MIRESLNGQMSDIGFVRCFMHLGICSWADMVMERGDFGGRKEYSK